MSALLRRRTATNSSDLVKHTAKCLASAAPTCRQPASGAAARPRAPAAGYKHLSPAQREKLEAALAGSADAAQTDAEAAECIRTEVRCDMGCIERFSLQGF